VRKSILVTIAILAIFSSKPASAQVAKLYPVDEAASNPSFFTFRARLLKAVNERDAAYVVSIVSPTIRNSFGGDGGIVEFKRMWRIDRPNSELWKELSVVLALGGKFENKQMFMAPYLFSNFPEQFDAFEHGVIIGDNVRVRREPNLRSAVVQMLSFDIVKVIDWSPKRSRGEKSGWLGVQLADGQRGFVSEEFLRSPINYRAIFEKQGDKWAMTAFIAGD
jgi:hypothetical protein